MLNPNFSKVDIIFLHHSVGMSIIDQGELRGLLSEYNQHNGTDYRLWDHGYNADGLRDPQGIPQNRHFNVPGDNTNPDGYEAIFLQTPHNPSDNTLSHLLQYDVIMFKSCFPACNIESAEKLEKFKNSYRVIMGAMRRYPDKLFIPCTPPPLIPGWTNPAEAANARAFAKWLTSPDFLMGAANVITFDLFSSLVENNPAASDYNNLRRDFRPGLLGLKKDSHPNQKANRAVALRLAEALTKAIEQFRKVRV